MRWGTWSEANSRQYDKFGCKEEQDDIDIGEKNRLLLLLLYEFH